MTGCVIIYFNVAGTLKMSIFIWDVFIFRNGWRTRNPSESLQTWSDSTKQKRSQCDEGSVLTSWLGSLGIPLGGKQRHAVEQMCYYGRRLAQRGATVCEVPNLAAERAAQGSLDHLALGYLGKVSEWRRDCHSSGFVMVRGAAHTRQRGSTTKTFYSSLKVLKEPCKWKLTNMLA